MQEENTGQVQTLRELDRPEHLLVLALRAIAVGQADCPLLDKTFSAAYGPLAAEVLAAYFLLVRSISLAGRKRLRIHVPGCPCVSADEVAVVGVVAAAQASIQGRDEALLKMRLRFVVDREASEAIVFAAQVIGRTLERSGHVLPLRRHPVGTKAFQLNLVPTVH